MENVDVEKIKKEKNLKELLEFGIINIDKPSGLTSFKVSEHVKKILNVRKTSHFGTLDPKVTGVLPIALNRACKLTGFFIGHNKTYVGIMRFHEEINKNKVEEIINKKFIGKITQLPPVKSRVKRAERVREIKSFEILEQDENKKDFLFKTQVEGGTYIRKLVVDLAKELGIGGHMLELRRIKAGIFDEKDSITLYELENAIKNNKLKDIIIPAKQAIKKIFPVIEIKKPCVSKVLHGSPIYEKFLKKRYNIKKNNLVSVFSENQFIGVFKVVLEGKKFAKSEFTLQPLKN